MPGIEYEQLYRLMQLADRVSVNLERPTQERLNALAPKKDFQRELLNMLLEMDPKRAWAERYLREAPVDLMKASRQQLLRVPGIGPVGADAILKARRLGRLTDLSHLRQLNIRAPEQAAPYILLDGHRPVVQMSLF